MYSLPSNWKINNTDVQKKLGIKTRQTLSNSWSRLIDLGYVVRNERKKEGGLFGGYDYSLIVPTVYGSTVHGENRHGSDRVRSDHARSNRTHNNTNVTNTKISNIQESNNTKISKSQRLEKAVDAVFEIWKKETGKKIRESSETNRNFIKNILKIKDVCIPMIEKVIQLKVFEWSHNPKMKDRIVLKTIFAKKNFETYFDEVLNFEDNPKAKEDFVARIKLEKQKGKNGNSKNGSGLSYSSRPKIGIVEALRRRNEQARTTPD